MLGNKAGHNGSVGRVRVFTSVNMIEPIGVYIVPVELIAEASTNHGGSLSLAKEFVRAFADAGATFVKFQYTRVVHLRPDDPQRDWFTKAELSDQDFIALRDECTKAGTKLLLTVYHAADVPFVANLGLEAIKIGSGEAHEVALTHAVRSAFRRVIVGCGLTIPERTGFQTLTNRVDYLRCVTRYPHPGVVGRGGYSPWGTLLAYCGYSDHAIGIEGCQLAILDGASVIEKHVQLWNQARQIQPWEASVEQFKELRRFADEDPKAKYLGRWQHG